MWPDSARRLNGRVRKSPPTTDAAAFVELLEDRTLLSAASVGEVPSLHIVADAFASDSIIVRYRSDAAASAAAHAAGNRALPLQGMVSGLRKVQLVGSMSVEQALAAYRADPNVLYAEPDYQVQLQLTPNDPRFSELWGLNNVGQTGGTTDADIDGVEAWDIVTGSGSIIVAVIDTGVDYTHEDLAANMWVNSGEIPGDGIDNDGNGFVDDVHGFDFYNFDSDPMDDHNHGTHVAGTIGAVANNGIGVAGVNWNVRIMALKFLSASGSGSISNAIAALNYAVANGAVISNNSWGFNGAYSQALDDAIAAAQQAGHIFVAAAGNGNFAGVGLDNDVTPFWPANSTHDNVVAVAALDHNNQKATFSNYGAVSVDVGAPGVGILSTTIGNTYSTFSGTSMATPHSAGLLSLIWDQNPTWEWQQVIDRLYETAQPLPALDGITTTGGIINAHAAVGPDVTGPRVRSTDPAGFEFDPQDSIRVLFSEAIDAATFTTDDIISFLGPEGPISIIDVVPVAGSASREFDITFALQEELGAYRLVLGSQITDLAGNLLDQNRNGVGGEVDDQFEIAYDLVPFFARLDFGRSNSPVAAGFQKVDPSVTYTSARGFGWTSGTIDSRDRGATAGDDETRDFNVAHQQASFVVDVPAIPAVYRVTVTMGDGLSSTAPRDEMGVFLEGALFGSVTSPPGGYVINSWEVTVSDGQLNIDLQDLGGLDPVVLINSLVVEALGPDLVGPHVIATTPSGEFSGSFDRIRLTFNEAVDAATFTLADIVSLNGPQGPITPLDVVPVNDREFEVLFPVQHEIGSYSLTIGPDIADTTGNLMDQDGDRVNGETPDDRFTAILELVPVQPLDARFDFGTTSSVVADGYTRVSQVTTYSPAQGYGWASGSIDSRDRGGTTGDELERDFNFTTQGTFVVDVPSQAVYTVTLTMGDGLGYVRDQMGIFLEGTLVDTVTTDGVNYAVRTYEVLVTDGQLTLMLEDFGGDSIVVINGLTVVTTEPDTSGPRIVAVEPTEASGTLDRLRVTFDQSIDLSTLSLDDVRSLTGPSGTSITPTAISLVGGTTYEIQFPQQVEVGTYTLVMGPDIADLFGNLMDQDADGIGGQEPDDLFTATIELAPLPPFEARFDFGTTSSPVADGYTRIANGTTYSSSTGYGWVSGSIQSRDRGATTGDDLERDFNYTPLGTFAVDVPEDGLYEVTLVMGDGLGYVRDNMGIYLEGVLVDTVTTDGHSYTVVTYRTQVTDGQLTITFDDLGGDPIVVINALDVRVAPPDHTGPRVIAVEPGSLSEGSIDRFTLTFDELMDGSSFSIADIVSLEGPDGAITPTSVNRISGTIFEVMLPEQTTPGVYTLVLGPDIADLSGNLMDQNQNGTGGETPGDRFTATTTLSLAPPFEVHFDFGTSSSVLAENHLRVHHATTYTAAQGYGWTSGTIYSRDRGSFTGDERERDFNYTTAGTFVVDVPAGVYDVTLVMGDGLGYTRDQMGIFIEGEFIDSVTSTGSTYAVNTYRVTVTDGQLTLRLEDLGGDPLVMINALDIVEVTDEAAASWQPDDSSDATASESPPPEPAGQRPPPALNGWERSSVSEFVLEQLRLLRRVLTD
jgi:subtilisin family serine protease/fibronectin type 3 domain-containing protein/methionine-rich copper-binding protein CopC